MATHAPGAFTGYFAATAESAWIERSERCRIRVSGPDRAKLLHNLTTKNVKTLRPGDGFETFVMNAQGRTLGYVSIHAEEDALLVRSDLGTEDALLKHFRKYGMFDDARCEGVSESTWEFHLAGPKRDLLLESLGIEIPDRAFLDVRAGDGPAWLIRESPTGRPGLTVIPRGVSHRETLISLIESRAPRMTRDEFEALRIEAGALSVGADLSEANLPQEFDRDSLAIDFVKGCYLGQETVARLDALGHVNKILRGCRLAPGSPVPEAGTPLSFEGKDAGAISSAAFSPGWNAPIALAMIKVARAAEGSVLDLEVDGEMRRATVHRLPMIPT